MKARFLIAITAVGLGAAVAVPPVAAQTPGQDSVTGSGSRSDDPFGGFSFTADAHSGPSGESPTGTMSWSVRSAGSDSQTVTQVSCLSVADNVAVVGVSGTFTVTMLGGSFGGWVTGLVRVTDGGVGTDTLEFSITEGTSLPPPPGPTDCSAFPPGRPVSSISGGVVVVDAPPTTYTQCRQAGWVKYGYASHAQCITAVHDLARQKCLFERVAHGITAFRAKYGLGPNDDHAMRHCVRLYTGF
jgi:hypothetical protein